MKKVFPFIVIILGVILATHTSCISNQDTVYFQSNSWNKNSPTKIINTDFEYRLKPEDVISVRIKSVNAGLTQHMNLEPESNINGYNDVGLFVNGYSIDSYGQIVMPDLGDIKVGGMTIEEARRVIQTEVNKTIPKATVIVKLVSFRIAVLGEVNQPGYYSIYNTRFTLLEALSMAGDLLEFANREKITLVRQVEDGSDVIILDLTDPDIIANPYYYLKPNDAVYVEPLEIKNKRSNQDNLRIFSVAFGAITAIATTVAVVLSIDDNNN